MLLSNKGMVLPYFDYGVPDWLIQLQTPPSPEIAWLVFGIFYLAVIFVTIGFNTRMSLIIMIAIYMYYYMMMLHFHWASYERISILVFTLLLFSGCHKAFSLDMLRKHGSFFAWEKTCVLPQRLIAVQLTMTYWGVGWQKLWLPDWQSGEILAYSFISRWATPMAFFVARLNIPVRVYDVIVYLVNFFEFCWPFTFWFKGVRWAAMAFGVFFHVFIALFLSIWKFIVLIPAYIVFFSPEEVLGFFERLFPGKLREVYSKK